MTKSSLEWKWAVRERSQITDRQRFRERRFNIPHAKDEPYRLRNVGKQDVKVRCYFAFTTQVLPVNR